MDKEAHERKRSKADARHITVVIARLSVLEALKDIVVKPCVATISKKSTETTPYAAT